MSDELRDLPPVERSLALRLRRTLRAGDSLDAITASRLAAARARALEGATSHDRAAWWWTSGGLAAVAVAAASVLLFSPALRSPAVVAEPGEGEALDLLVDEVDPELYEDLDLYRWLAQEENRA
ncbi:hypothetical protein EON77_13010 [bacterium]|nr:MAG: hypothetical protein EON77_13010 [bacterium]